MIHAEHPFADLPEDRDPVRRFRGRLVSPVTIFTSGEGDRRTGLTVSSLFVAEGELGRLHAVVGPNTDLWDVVAETERFVVHVCGVDDTGLAEVFAGLRPSPGLGASRCHQVFGAQLQRMASPITGSKIRTD